MSNGMVLSLCDYTTNAVRDWADAGYHCVCVDLQHPPGLEKTDHPNIWTIGADVNKWSAIGVQPWVFAQGFPPCDNMSVSGARWFVGKGLNALADSIRLVASCASTLESLGCPYYLENPISTLSTYWRQPDYKFDPYEYAGYLDDPTPEAYTKRTCLWTGGAS